MTRSATHCNGGGVSFFLRLGSVLKYSPDQPRDEHGRWTTGEGSVFVSPNVGHLNVRTAFNALSSQRHEAMVVAGAPCGKLPASAKRQPAARRTECP
jgi:hypothetical protein